MSDVSGFSSGNWRAGAAALALVAALGGCGKQPGGQVVAVVQGEEITQQELRAEAELAQIPQTQDFQAVAPGLLQRVIERNLLADYARNQGLDRGPEYVARRRQLEQTLLATLALRKLSGTPGNPTPAEVQKFINDRPTHFARRERLTLDQIRLPVSPGRERIKELTELGSIDAIAARLTADRVQFQRGRPNLDTATVDPAVAKQIVALPPNEIFDLTTAAGTFISVVAARTPIATPPQSWTAPATEAAKRDRSAKSIQEAVAKLRKDAKIEYDAAFKPAAAPASPAAPAAAK